MKINKDQRVAVFVDVQNLYYSAKNLYNSKVNFAEVLKQSVRGRKLIRAKAYVIKADIKEEKSFHGALENQGYEVRSKDLQTFPGGAKKGDWDIGIAMDAIEQAPKIDTVILVSGDGDYVDLLQHLRRALGCRVETMAFGTSTSGKLREEADEFIDMDKNRTKFLIPYANNSQGNKQNAHRKTHNQDKASTQSMEVKKFTVKKEEPDKTEEQKEEKKTESKQKKKTLKEKLLSKIKKEKSTEK